MEPHAALKPLTALLEQYYDDERNGICGFIASSVNTDIAVLSEKPLELESYMQTTVQVLFDGKPDILLRGLAEPMHQDTRGPTVVFDKVARGLWVRRPDDGPAVPVHASTHAVVLCKMTDGTYVILDGNEGQFSHIEGACTFHVQEADLAMKGATLAHPPASP